VRFASADCLIPNMGKLLSSNSKARVVFACNRLQKCAVNLHMDNRFHAGFTRSHR
jgi:hypothetical protein